VRDLLELALGAVREQRRVLDQLDLLVSVEHGTSLSLSTPAANRIDASARMG
jgi:hypothetical protein